MGIKREFTGIEDLGYSNSSIKIENKKGKDLRIEITKKSFLDDDYQVIWIDIKTAVQLSKELRNVISQAKEKI